MHLIWFLFFCLKIFYDIVMRDKYQHIFQINLMKFAFYLIFSDNFGMIISGEIRKYYEANELN